MWHAQTIYAEIDEATNMMTYAKGDAHTNIVSSGTNGILEMYRNITYKSNNANIRTLL